MEPDERLDVRWFKKIVDYTHVNPSDRAVFLPSTYKGKYDIYGKEINAFAKLSATLFKRWGKTDHRILLGGEYRLEGNVGKGKVFDRMAPPYRNLQALNATFRPRAYKDIPFIQHGSFFVEENLTVQQGLQLPTTQLFIFPIYKTPPFIN